jgi:hypothetical protein
MSLKGVFLSGFSAKISYAVSTPTKFEMQLSRMFKSCHCMKAVTMNTEAECILRSISKPLLVLLIWHFRVYHCDHKTYHVFTSDIHFNIIFIFGLGEEEGSNGNVSDLYSGSAEFESLSVDRLSLQRFSGIFLSPFRQMPGWCLKLGHDILLPLLLHFIIRNSRISTRCTVRDTDSVIK